MAERRMSEKMQTACQVALQVFEEVKQPLHYDQLLQAMVLRGYDPQVKGNPGHAVYAHLYNHIKLFGDESPFVFLKRGIFASKGTPLNEAQVAAAQAPPRRAVSRKADSELTEEEKIRKFESLKRREYALNLPRTCGHCMFMTFTGPKEVTMDSGTCEKDQESGRPYNRSEAEACPLWRARPHQTRLKDRARQADLLKIVEAHSLGLTSARVVRSR